MTERHRPPGAHRRQASVLGSSAVMAAGTVVSRATGLVRNAMLLAALGSGLSGDVFNIANTVPNMLYILLAGGVFNAVLVPQLVRAQQKDPDGGDAYTNRIITLAGLFLAGASAVLVALAPLLMRLFLDHSYFTEACAQPREAVFAFARWCLPQVFFYGMFVLVGQVLNARGRFGPMMWAPITNNLVAITTLAVYRLAYGKTTSGHFSAGQEALLGLGSTLGIAVQLLVLLPALRAAGFRFRPRYDFRRSGLGHTARLGVWTLLFVVVNQIAYAVVVRIASSGTAPGGATCGGAGSGTGYTVYSNAFLLIMVPHAIITVSLATAVLPRLSRYAAREDYPAVGRDVAATLRMALAAILPLAALVPVVAKDAASLAFGYGAAARTAQDFVPTLSLFALGLVLFTVHYVSLRGYYALEDTRQVFRNQCWVAATNIVVALALWRGAPASQVAPRLVIAYAASYLVGSVLSTSQLSRRLGGLEGARTTRFVIRLAFAAGGATLAGWLALHGVRQVVDGTGKPAVLLRLAVTGLVDVLVVLVIARLMRITEIGDVVRQVARRGAR
jgi:putative peptidoglycan lipid II flippase